jgi:hypothetical protein
VGKTLLEAGLGSHLQGPQARVLAELSGTLVQHLPKSFGSIFIEGLMRRGVWAARALSKSRFKASLVELMDDVAHSLGVAAKLGSDLIGTLLCIGAGKQDLTTAQGEGLEGERRPAFKVSRSASLRGRAKIGSLIPGRINSCLLSCLDMHYY